MTDDDDIRAAEYALGLTDPGEATQLAKREANDAAFRARVAWWREQLTPLSDESDAVPTRDVWARIERALPQNDNAVTTMQRWRAAAIGTMAVAASLVGVLVLKPAPIVPQPQIMVASLQGTAGAPATVAYESVSGQLTVVPAAFDVKGHDAELWIIPADGKPRSLGVIDVTHTSHPSVAADRRTLIKSGSTFAISLEPRGGSPTGLPTGPVVGAGKVSTT